MKVIGRLTRTLQISAPRFWSGLGLMLGIAVQTVQAAGPAQVARLDGQLWPDALNSPRQFDKASRAHLRLYRQELEQQIQANASAPATQDLERVRQWLGQQSAQTERLQTAARLSCLPQSDDWTCQADQPIPVALADWQRNARQFVRSYQAEQLRLWLLWPKVSSEIERFDADEILGDELPDRQFLLSFDDGPSANRHTPQLLQVLNSAGRTAVFFVLGEALAQRLQREGRAALVSRYAGQCVASHGWRHQSHARLPDWQASVRQTEALLQETFGAAHRRLFRPPYGQRPAKSAGFWSAQGLRLMLWTIDSQDWQASMSADDCLNRLLGLMLIKRRGILLMHDVHPKAAQLLPSLFDRLGAAVHWQDCADWPPPRKTATAF